MLDKTKATFKDELTKSLVDITTCSDPAPMPGLGTRNVLKAFKDDIKEMIQKHKNKKNERPR